MNDDTRDLISRLTTRVGMLMEDCSVDALTCGGLGDSEIEPMIDSLQQRVGQMAKLLNAAKAAFG